MPHIELCTHHEPRSSIVKRSMIGYIVGGAVASSRYKFKMAESVVIYNGVTTFLIAGYNCTMPRLLYFMPETTLNNMVFIKCILFVNLFQNTKLCR